VPSSSFYFKPTTLASWRSASDDEYLSKQFAIQGQTRPCTVLQKVALLKSSSIFPD